MRDLALRDEAGLKGKGLGTRNEDLGFLAHVSPLREVNADFAEKIFRILFH